ncbi:hypothetical protein ACGFX4_20035 [Kitasatospora sp. NPDC048365]|uniref:hypothetical protein n=1 Tax=Kitasatospora sp. NPDC048365 TaxID=3364050 RepID=UPI003720FE6F
MTSAPTWGHFTGLATDHLQQALGELATTAERSSEGVHAARADALAGVCRQLQPSIARFGPLAVDARLTSDEELGRLQQSLEKLNAELTRTATFFQPEVDGLALRLTDTAQILSFGRDILSSHHAPTGQPLTQYAAYLDSPTAAYEILAETAGLASMAGFAAMHLARLSPPVRRYSRDRAPLSSRVNVLAGQLELAATSINSRFSFAWPPVALAGPGVAELPLAPSQPPSSVLPGESRDVALHAVAASCEWLAAHAVRQQAQSVPDLTVGEIRDLAHFQAASHLLSARLIEHTWDATADGSTEARPYAEAASALRTSSRAWRTAAESWHSGLRSAPVGARPVALREAEFMTVRLGRMLFAQGWTPRDGFNRPVRPADQITAGPSTVTDLLNTVRTIAASSEVLAEHVPRIVASMANRGILLSSDPAFNPRGDTLAAQMTKGWTRWYAATVDQLNPVFAAYNAARTASADADAQLSWSAAGTGNPIPRARLDADRRRALAFTGDPDLDNQRVRASAARARSVLTPAQTPDGPRDFKERTRALRREIAEVYGTDRAQGRRR